MGLALVVGERFWESIISKEPNFHPLLEVDFFKNENVKLTAKPLYILVRGKSNGMDKIS